MVALGARMSPVDPDPFEMLRAELVEGLPRMVNRVIQSGKTEVQAAIDQIEQIRTTLAEVSSIDDFRDDLDAAERTLRLYLVT